MKGNPADSQQLEPLLERQCDLYGRYPRQASFDGGFASSDNHVGQKARRQGRGLCKKCGLKIEDIRSSWVYKQLRRFLKVDFHRHGFLVSLGLCGLTFSACTFRWSGWCPLYNFSLFAHSPTLILRVRCRLNVKELLLIAQQKRVSFSCDKLP